MNTSTSSWYVHFGKMSIIWSTSHRWINWQWRPLGFGRMSSQNFPRLWISGHIGGETTSWLRPLSPLSFYHSIIHNANVPFSLTSVAFAIGPSVTTSSTDFSFQNLVFWNLFEFSAAEIIQRSISPTLWIQVLPNKFH